MQEYLQRSRLSSLMDGIGLHILVLSLCLIWFLLLWGLCLPSLLAGLSLYCLITLLIKKMRDGRLARKEKQLRIRIGGEMALERLLTLPPSRAHFEVCMLLSQRYPMTLLQAGEDGVLCSLRGQRVLVYFQQSAFSSQITADQVLALQRKARAIRAVRAILCAPCPLSASAREQAQGEIAVRFFSRSSLIQLLGAVNPATDAQLVRLGKRRKATLPRRKWLEQILEHNRAPRYFCYGLLLAGLYLITKLIYYLIPGLLCLGLSVACRCRKKEKDVL